MFQRKILFDALSTIAAHFLPILRILQQAVYSS